MPGAKRPTSTKAKSKSKAATSRTPSLLEALNAAAPPRKLPPGLTAGALPDLVGTSPSTSVDPATKEALLSALMAGKLREGALVGAVRSSLTRESLDALALELLRFWQSKDFHGRYDWILDAVSAFRGDASLIALAEHMATWPGQSDSGRKRAIQAVPTLIAAGTDTALLALLGLRQTAVVPSVLEAIIDGLDEVVEERKTTLSELFDVITPTLGLDARGMRSFDYGRRRFTVAFDDHFEPHLRDESGHVVDELPPPEPGDDPMLAQAARAAWATLSAQLREAVKVQTFRLEQDMVGGRRWSAKPWTKLLRDHPLLVSFTRRLLWAVYEDDTLSFAFRTAEDQSLVGLDDVEVHLPEDARIGLVHPLHLDDASRAAWATSFADYEIIQPFAQLGRTIHRVEPNEISETATARFAETRFKSGVLRDVLVRKGWERDAAFHRRFYERTFARDGVVAIATMSPGVSAGSASYDVADQTIPTIELRKRTGRGMSRTPMPLAEAPPIAFSEAVLDLSDVLVEQDAR